MLVPFRRWSTQGLRWSAAFCVTGYILHASILLAGDRADGKQAAPMVPGFARFYAAPKADMARGGQLLLGELNCTSCHAAENAPARKSAPILDSVGTRVKRTYLQQFLNDPQGTKPGTTMPNLFAGLEAQDRAGKVEALVHFLATTGKPLQARPENKAIASGHALYHKIGCVACHGTRDAKGDQDQLFATSVALGNLKAKYTLGSLKLFLENPHQVRPSGRMPGLLTSKEAVEVANYLMQGTAQVQAKSNMHYAYYEGSWEKLPEFAKLKPAATGQASDFDLGVARRINNCALKFEGYVRIDREGSYTFHVTSDDGSRLWINDKIVVENDGIHPPTTQSGAVKLGKGMHKLVLGVFNAGGGFELGIDIEGSGLVRQPLGPLVHLSESAEATFVADNKDPNSAPLQPDLIARGKELFSSMGCANCHQLLKESKQLSAPALAKLKAEGGCLEGSPRKGIPWYGLSRTQQTALRSAVQSPAPAPTDAKEIIARTLTTFNCYACHERDKIGGVEDEVSKYFYTTQPEAGEEVRIPPPLNGVGAKLNAAYLRKILDQGSRDRPYMLTHMPRFGDANVGHLVKLLEEVDAPPPEPKVVLKEAVGKLKSAGRQMVGPKGFGCIKCHTFAGTKAEGVQGMDLAIMTERLRKEWFHPYMINPSKYRPGTRMPASWPEDGTSPLKNILDGHSLTQIEAVWVYLSDGKSANLPVGINKQSIPLVPVHEAILYRNFIQGAGPRAIGVGYPEKAHLAFDANDVRLAMIWQGAFMDARRHWTDRGVGFEPPMGDNILHLPGGVSFAVLEQIQEAWPAKPAREQGYKFLGYRLSDDQRPTFLYSYHGVKIEDFPNAVETKVSPTLKRTLTLTTETPVEKLYYRAALADRIEAVGAGWYRINEWRMHLEATDPPMIRRAGNKMELLVPVRFKQNSARILQEYVW